MYSRHNKSSVFGSNNKKSARSGVKVVGLQVIPGVGESVEQDFFSLNVKSVDGLRGRNPLSLYNQLMQQQGTHVDKCILYVFRCAVYYADTQECKRDPELLKWWNWSDKKAPKKLSVLMEERKDSNHTPVKKEPLQHLPVSAAETTGQKQPKRLKIE